MAPLEERAPSRGPAKTIRISEQLALPAEDFIEAKFAVIGQSGRGKSGLLKVIEEELVRVGLPFVVFDPAGVAWGIRSSADGKGPGLPVLVIGGDHADIPLDPKGGADAARAIVQANISCVIDFSGESKAHYRSFVRDFADTLYAVNDTSRLVILDEAPELVPQRLRPDQTQTYDAVERLVRQGRNRGIGVGLVTQRAATVAKDVLTQCGSLVIFGLVGAPDRKALKEWVEAKADPDQLAAFEAGLAGLKQREAFFWSPQEFEQFTRIRVNEFKTLHPDRTHLRKHGLLTAKAVTVDVSGVVSKLGAQLAQVKADKVDPAEVRRLRAELAQLRSKQAAPPKVETRQVADERAMKAAVAQAVRPLQQQLRLLQEFHEGLRRSLHRVDQEADAALQKFGEIPKLDAGSEGWSKAGPTRFDSPRPVVSVYPSPSVRGSRVVPDAGESADPSAAKAPTGGALRMLRYLVAVHPGTVERMDLGAAASVSPNSGTFSDYSSLLRRSGYLQDHSDGSFSATAEGVEFFGAKTPTRPTHQELAAEALRRVSGGARRMLQELISDYPRSLSRQALGERASIAPNSGTFSDYLSLLKRLGFVKVEGSEVTAAEVLFP